MSRRKGLDQKVFNKINFPKSSKHYYYCNFYNIVDRFRNCTHARGDLILHKSVFGKSELYMKNRVKNYLRNF